MIEEILVPTKDKVRMPTLYCSHHFTVFLLFSSVAAFPQLGLTIFVALPFCFGPLGTDVVSFSTVGLTTVRNTNVSVVALVRQVFTDRMRCK